MKRNQISPDQLRAKYQENIDRCRNVKPWSFELDGERYNVPTDQQKAPNEPLIKGAYQNTNNKAHRDFSERVASIPRYISTEHRSMLDEYVDRHGCSLRDAIEKGIELLLRS